MTEIVTSNGDIYNVEEGSDAGPTINKAIVSVGGEQGIDDLYDEDASGTVWVYGDVILRSSIYMKTSVTLDFLGNTLHHLSKSPAIRLDRVSDSALRNVHIVVDTSSTADNCEVYADAPISVIRITGQPLYQFVNEQPAKRCDDTETKRISFRSSGNEFSDISFFPLGCKYQYIAFDIVHIGPPTEIGQCQNAIIANVFQRILCTLPHTVVKFYSERDDLDHEVYINGNLFADVFAMGGYRYLAQFTSDLDDPDLPACNMNTFTHVLGDRSRPSRGGFSAIHRNGNHFDHCGSMPGDSPTPVLYNDFSDPSELSGLTSYGTYICAHSPSDLISFNSASMIDDTP